MPVHSIHRSDAARVVSRPSACPQNISWLHRLFRIRPGFAPTLVCAKEECSPLDLLRLFEIIPVLIAVFSWRVSLPLAMVSLAVGIVVALGIELFRHRERLARARIRRGECGQCGQQLVGAHLHCLRCDA